MTANYFVIKNLIQNQLMGDKVICSADTHQQNTKFVPICIYLSVQCGGSLLQIFLAAFSILLQRSFRNWRNNSITGAC